MSGGAAGNEGLTACGQSPALKEHDFSRAVSVCKMKAALAAEGRFYWISTFTTVANGPMTGNAGTAEAKRVARAIADSRKAVLERVRAATGESASRNSPAAPARTAPPDSEIPRQYVRKGDKTVSARRERFVERLREYDAEVVECAPDGLAAAIAAQLHSSGGRVFVVPEGLPKEWLAEGFEWKIDGNLEVRDVEQADGVVTACFCGVAESGTIVLHHGPAEGRRLISLLPDRHLCVVRAGQVVETLPEYFDRCREQGDGSAGEREAGEAQTRTAGPETGHGSVADQAVAALPRLVTWIAGPSATADIEMTRIKGVHGPRFLHVVLVRD